MANDNEAPAADDVPATNDKKSRWKLPSLKPIKNAFSSLNKKIQNFRKSSGIEEAEGRLLDELRNTTFAKSLQAKYQKPDTSFARVEIFVDDFVMAEGDGQYDIDKVLAALQDLNNLLL